MNKIRCIIVEDEPLSLDVMEKFVKDTPSLLLVGTCMDAYKAMEMINSNTVDLIFLDINMPGLSGLQMIKSIQDPPKVIFTTAYPEYAVEGFEVDAIDYLLKPFDYERFLKAVQKYSRIARQKKEPEKILWLKSEKKLHKVNVEDIFFIEAVGDYLKVITGNTTLLVYERMTKMESELEIYNFCRVHRSYIISLDKIDFIEGNRIRIFGENIPLGQTYRDNFNKKLGREN